jgi:hypothetical protein
MPAVFIDFNDNYLRIRCLKLDNGPVGGFPPGSRPSRRAAQIMQTISMLHRLGRKLDAIIATTANLIGFRISPYGNCRFGERFDVRLDLKHSGDPALDFKRK